MQQNISLFNPKLEPKSIKFSVSQIGYIFALTLILAISYTSYLRFERNALNAKSITLQQGLDTAQKELAAHARAVASYDKKEAESAIEAARLKLATINEELDSLENMRRTNNRGYASLFIALGEQRVDGVWLTKIKVHGDSQYMELSGKTIAPELLPNYLKILQSDNAFKGIGFGEFSLSPTNTSDTRGADKYSFELSSVMSDSRVGGDVK